MANAPNGIQGDPFQYQWSTFTQGEWVVHNSNANNFTAYIDSEIDLRGLTQQEKTIFFKNMEVQMPYPPSMLDAIAGDNLQLQLIISEHPVSFFDAYGGGQASSVSNPEDILLMRTQTWLVDQDTKQWGSIMKLANETSTGLLQATASDTLYVRYLVFLGTKRIDPEEEGPYSTIEKFTVPPTLIVLEVDTEKEDEDQYIYRLLRSFRLAQGRDLDAS